uniref:hypothetical protein n=1 Tax=Aliarcobacter sp. TaxID=2321116 RepID=UPI0040472FBE
MYLLNDTPIFLEFFKRFCKFAGYEFKNKKIHNKLFLHSKCNCGQKNCATINLKSKKPFKKKIQRSQIIETNKGFFIIHFLKNGFFEFEALLYKKFPYKNEIDKYFHKRKKIKKLSIKDRQNLHKYFKDLKFREPNIINLGEVNFDEDND